RLVCYDKVKLAAVDRLRDLAWETRFSFHEADVLGVEIDPTDLLFIDTWHVYGQLREELRLHGGKARKYIVLPDTPAFGERGEIDGHRGLWPAVEEFLALGTFRLLQRYENNNGLTVLATDLEGAGHGAGGVGAGGHLDDGIHVHGGTGIDQGQVARDQGGAAAPHVHGNGGRGPEAARLHR